MSAQNQRGKPRLNCWFVATFGWTDADVLNSIGAVKDCDWNDRCRV